MSMWLSATPDFSVEAAKQAFIKWSLGAIILFIMTVVELIVAFKSKQ